MFALRFLNMAILVVGLTLIDLYFWNNLQRAAHAGLPPPAPCSLLPAPAPAWGTRPLSARPNFAHCGRGSLTYAVVDHRMRRACQRTCERRFGP